MNTNNAVVGVARLNGLKISPKKVLICIRVLKKKYYYGRKKDKRGYVSIPQSYRILDEIRKRAAMCVKDTIKSAVANALQKKEIKFDELAIKRIELGPARSLKRYHPRAKGVSNKIIRRSSNITIKLERRN